MGVIDLCSSIKPKWLYFNIGVSIQMASTTRPQVLGKVESGLISRVECGLISRVDFEGLKVA